MMKATQNISVICDLKSQYMHADKDIGADDSQVWRYQSALTEEEEEEEEEISPMHAAKH